MCHFRLDSDAQTNAVRESKLFTVTEKSKEEDKSPLLSKSMSVLQLPQENVFTGEAKEKNSLRKISGHFPQHSDKLHLFQFVSYYIYLQQEKDQWYIFIFLHLPQDESLQKSMYAFQHKVAGATYSQHLLPVYRRNLYGILFKGTRKVIYPVLNKNTKKNTARLVRHG